MRVTTIYEPKLVELWNERSKRLKQSERQRELRARMAPLAVQSAAAGAPSIAAKTRRREPVGRLDDRAAQAFTQRHIVEIREGAAARRDVERTVAVVRHRPAARRALDRDVLVRGGGDLAGDVAEGVHASGGDVERADLLLNSARTTISATSSMCT